jgi:hypothetical protein
MLAAVATSAIASAGCVADPEAPAGTWGGEHAVLEIQPTRSSLELDCATGSVDQPFRLASSGEFDLDGTFSPGHGGPIREDEVAARYPARYTGDVDGETMRLEIERLDTHDRIGPFTLRAGVTGRVFKCL